LKILSPLPPIFVLALAYMKGFERLVTEVTKVVPNIILVIVYHPLVTSCPIFHMLPKASVITELIVRFTLAKMPL